MTITATGLDPVALRNALGLDDDASDDEVQTALAAAGFTLPSTSQVQKAPGSEQPGTTQSGAATPPSDAAVQDVQSPDHPRNDPATSQPEVTPPMRTAASQPQPQTADVVQLDRATYQRLLAGAATAERLDERDRHSERDRLIAQAVSDSKIEPSRVDHWKRKFDEDPEGTKHLLTASFDQGGLAPGVVPLSAVGQSQSTEDTSADAYPTEWLPEVHRHHEQKGIQSDGG